MAERPKILCLRRGALGDTLLMLPILRALRTLAPGAELWFAGNLDHAVLLAHYRVVEAVRSSEDFELWALGNAAADPARQRAVARLRRFAWLVTDCIDPVQLPEHGGLVQRLEVAMQPGAALPAAQQILAGWARSLPEPPAVLDHQPRLLARRQPVGERREVLLHPGSGSPRKCWPLERFAALSAKLCGDGHRVACLLGEAEVGRRASIREAMPAGVELLAGLDVVQLAERIASAAVFVGNDSGPTHLAAALLVPTVAVFGPTDPVVWAPQGEHVRVVGAPTRGTPQATVEEVLAAVRSSGSTRRCG